jgi:hypothetical protein
MKVAAGLTGRKVERIMVTGAMLARTRGLATHGEFPGTPAFQKLTRPRPTTFPQIDGSISGST